MNIHVCDEVFLSDTDNSITALYDAKTVAYRKIITVVFARGRHVDLIVLQQIIMLL